MNQIEEELAKKVAERWGDSPQPKKEDSTYTDRYAEQEREIAEQQKTIDELEKRKGSVDAAHDKKIAQLEEETKKGKIASIIKGTHKFFVNTGKKDKKSHGDKYFNKDFSSAGTTVFLVFAFLIYLGDAYFSYIGFTRIGGSWNSVWQSITAIATSMIFIFFVAFHILIRKQPVLEDKQELTSYMIAVILLLFTAFSGGLQGWALAHFIFLVSFWFRRRYVQSIP